MAFSSISPVVSMLGDREPGPVPARNDYDRTTGHCGLGSGGAERIPVRPSFVVLVPVIQRK